MAKVRVLVVDDEPLARTNLVLLLRGDPAVELVGECGSGAAALKEIAGLKPDVVFLDVQMPEIDGFDVLERLAPELPVIVFVTAYDQYALQAFAAGALDYILKPFDTGRFRVALQRAKSRVALGLEAPAAASLVVRNAGEVLFLPLTDVDWIEAADYYASVHTGMRTHLVRRSMADLERQLDPSAFCRIHRSAIVRLDRVRSLSLNASGEYDVTLSDGRRLRMSRRYRKTLQSRLNGLYAGRGD